MFSFSLDKCVGMNFNALKSILVDLKHNLIKHVWNA
jgi:hypothetical protein